MAENTKLTANKTFRKICSFTSIVKQDFLGKYLNKLSPYAREYESTLDLVLAILHELGFPEDRLTIEILDIVIGENSFSSLIEGGYHGTLNSLEEKLSLIESNWENNSFIYHVESTVKTIISSILTAILTCSVSPFIPKRCIDIYHKQRNNDSDIEFHPINIPTKILDFSNTLHVSPVSESGIYFYNTGCDIKYYERDNGTVEQNSATVAGSKDPNAEKVLVYNYEKMNDDDVEAVGGENFVKVVSVKNGIRVREGQPAPEKYVYTIRPKFTAEGLYKTDDMNAFIWYVINRGNNEEPTPSSYSVADMYEYNKMMWDSRRRNNLKKDRARTTGEDWDSWLNSKTSFNEKLVFSKVPEGGTEPKEVKTLYPILQFEPSVDYGDLEHVVVTFPAQRYLIDKEIKFRRSIDIPFTDKDIEIVNLDTNLKLTKTIYKFNADYLNSIKIFNCKTILMNLLYELNGVSPVPHITATLSLSDEIIDAKLSTLIMNTIMADDKEIDDSFYSFSNEDYIEALRRMELKKYGAKAYKTASTTAIQNPGNTPVDAMNSISTAATLNEITSTIQRQLYNVEGTSGSTGVTKTTLSASLFMETNFIYELLFAIVKPFVRALLSPEIMLLFIINLDVMGLVNVSSLGRVDMDVISDFIFRKLAGIIKKMVIFVKNNIVEYIIELIKREIRKLVDQVLTLILLEQLNDYIRLLTQALECVRRFGIGITVSGIDEVNYADIIPEANTPEANT